MIDVDGVVGRLVQLMQDAHLALGQGSSREDGVAEMVLGNHLRTGERKEDATTLYLLKGLLVESRIPLQGIVQGTPVLGKGRRIKDDEVVTLNCVTLNIEH